MGWGGGGGPGGPRKKHVLVSFLTFQISDLDFLKSQELLIKFRFVLISHLKKKILSETQYKRELLVDKTQRKMKMKNSVPRKQQHSVECKKNISDAS